MKDKTSIVKIEKVFFKEGKIFFSLEDGQEVDYPPVCSRSKSSYKEQQDCRLSPEGLEYKGIVFI